MSEAEDGSMSDADIGLEDFDDFDPLAESGDDEGDAVAAAAPDDDSEDEAGEGDDIPLRRRETSVNINAVAAGTRRIIVIAPEDRVTSHVMSLAEATRAIALRAQQISVNPNAFTDFAGLTDAKAIALKEFLDRRSPLVLRRTVGRTAAGEAYIEKWPVREMAYPPLD